jgi:hypothetical protein
MINPPKIYVNKYTREVIILCSTGSFITKKTELRRVIDKTPMLT